MELIPRRPILTNPFSMIAGVLALVSAFSPWWGIGGAGEPTFYYGLFAGTYDSALTASQITRILVQYSPVILGLVILSGLFAILGTFNTAIKYQLAGFASSLAAASAYPVILMYSLGASCQNLSWCIFTPTGSEFGFTWGFQIGYYLVLASTLLYPAGILFRKTFLSSETVRAVSEKGSVRSATSQFTRFDVEPGRETAPIRTQTAKK